MVENQSTRPIQSSGRFKLFFDLPVKLRRLVYRHAGLVTSFILRSDHILDNIDGKSMNTAGFLDTHPRIRVEAFSTFIRQNIIDVTDLAYVFPIMEDYLATTQTEMDLWRCVRTARIDHTAAFGTKDGKPSEYTRHIIGLLKRCKRLNCLELYFDPTSSAEQLSYLLESDLMEYVGTLPSFRELVLCWPVGNLLIPRQPTRMRSYWIILRVSACRSKIVWINASPMLSSGWNVLDHPSCEV